MASALHPGQGERRSAQALTYTSEAVLEATGASFPAVNLPKPQAESWKRRSTKTDDEPRTAFPYPTETPSPYPTADSTTAFNIITVTTSLENTGNSTPASSVVAWRRLLVRFSH